MTKQDLEAELAELTKQQEQVVGQLNAIAGARQILLSLIAKIDAKSSESAA